MKQGSGTPSSPSRLRQSRARRACRALGAGTRRRTPPHRWAPHARSRRGRTVPARSGPWLLLGGFNRGPSRGQRVRRTVDAQRARLAAEWACVAALEVFEMAVGKCEEVRRHLRVRFGTPARQSRPLCAPTEKWQTWSRPTRPLSRPHTASPLTAPRPAVRRARSYCRARRCLYARSW
jgi:hypothetical protein